MIFSALKGLVDETYSQTEKMVRVDGALLKSRYDHWNTHLFGGQLPKEIKFTVSKNTGYLGQTAAQIITQPQMANLNQPAATVQSGSLTIDISSHWKYTNKILDAVLLHEMVHVWFYIMGKTKEEHGPEFMSKLRELSSRTGFKIPTKNDPDELPHLIDSPGRRVIALVREKKDGRRSAALFAPYSNIKPADLVAYWSSMVGDDKLQVYDTVTAMANMLPVKTSIKDGVFNFVEPDQLLDIQSGHLVHA